MCKENSLASAPWRIIKTRPQPAEELTPDQHKLKHIMSCTRAGCTLCSA